MEIKKCLNGWTKDEINMNFGSEDLKNCNRCDNLKYQSGIMMCVLLKEDEIYEN